MKSYQIGIDIGTTCMKVSYYEDGLKNPSVWQLPSFFFPCDTEERFARLRLTEPKSYSGIVGADVRLHDRYNVTRQEDLYGSKKHLLGVFYAIGHSLDCMMAKEQCTVSLGLAIPAGHMGKADELIKMLQGKKINSVQVNEGIARQVIIDRVHIVPQGTCVLFDQVFQRKNTLTGKRGVELLENGSITTMVLGSNSIELAHFRGDFRKVSAESIFRGVLEIAPELGTYAHSKCGFQPTQYQIINSILCKKQLEGVNFEHINRRLVHAFMHDAEIKSGVGFFLRNAKKEPGKRGNLILGGGPCLYGIDPLEKQFAEIFSKVKVAADDRNKPEPHLSVIRGLAKYIEIKQQ